MNKSRTARLVGFLGALGASAALVGTAVHGTGAYFTDSKSGNINAGTGHVRVDTPSGTELNFDNLLPGEYKTQRVNYVAQGSEAEDIWLVFPTDGSADAFVGTPSPGPTPLGRYGHLYITSNAGASFISNNLSTRPSSDPNGAQCSTDANGSGGSDAEAQSPSDKTVPYCSPVKPILLQSNMNPGAAGYADIQFGYTRLLTAPQDSGRQLVAKYKIVATQHGVRPDNIFN